MKQGSGKTLVRTLCCVLVLAAFSGAAWAELQNVTVGGELRMRGRWYHNTFSDGAFGPVPQLRIPSQWLRQRPIGTMGQRFLAPSGMNSLFKWDERGPDWKFYETAVQLWVDADFTDNVSARIGLYDYYIWGSNNEFRSNYITGGDSPGSNADPEFLESYIQAEDMFGMPLRLRIGRQTIRLGKGWLVCDMLTPTQRLSFDGVRLTYHPDNWEVDAFAFKLAEAGIAEEDGDVDFYGLHAAYKGIEAFDIAGYWYYLRDARSLNDTNFVWWVEALEDLANLDDYDPTELHTVGLRLNGKTGNFDYDLELAYQFGNADVYGQGFAPFGATYGDTGAEFDNWGAEATLGYTFADMAWKPRVYVQGALFTGEDNRDISWWDWVNPFDRPQASVSFNRLFSDKNYMPVVNDNGWMSNFYEVSLNTMFKPTSSITVNMGISKGWAYEAFDPPLMWKFGKFEIPVMPVRSYVTQEGSDDLGTEFSCWVKYDYSEDLWFLVYYNHLFTGGALEDGAFVQLNGTSTIRGTSGDDADYAFIMAVLKF